MPINILERFRMPANCIIETVVSTYNHNQTPNAAPMGIILSANGRLIIKPYVETRTFNNLKLWKECVVNFTQNPELFFKTAFKQSEELPAEWFKAADIVKAPRIREADAYVEASTLKIEAIEGRGEIECTVVNSAVLKPPPLGYCRAAFALIESIIHATRVEELYLKGRRDEAKNLLNLIENYDALIKRVAPNSDFSRMMEQLKSELNRFK